MQNPMSLNHFYGLQQNPVLGDPLMYNPGSEMHLKFAKRQKKERALKIVNYKNKKNKTFNPAEALPLQNTYNPMRAGNGLDMINRGFSSDCYLQQQNRMIGDPLVYNPGPEVHLKFVERQKQERALKIAKYKSKKRIWTKKIAHEGRKREQKLNTNNEDEEQEEEEEDSGEFSVHKHTRKAENVPANQI